jgi:hypothetical protein
MTPNNNCDKATTCSVTSQIAQHVNIFSALISQNRVPPHVVSALFVYGGIAYGMRPIGSADWW